ncbi:hypothetical protein HRD49_17350 [Corallococcus exiguus]|uniref:hypothetical protein n=1 Tax=Corallococcus TaxID=83461 RepID=UPI000F862BBE|nr:MULTISPECIES: hypothetical protein [Corallococcus]NNC19208.1 hypothetical protein [Corallococcus exiguus]NRD57661.1 hypothetical protein [Corallococcus exiguus]NRD63520.1 hypothetical protein [Corallococcus exiguus]
MPMPPHKVGIVVDQGFGDRVAELARAFHVWVVESRENTPVIQGVWKSGLGDAAADPLAVGVTSFAALEGESPEAMCARIAGDVAEHHGEFAHDPPWSEMEVFGVKLTSTLRHVFEELEATACIPTPEGFVCRRLLPSGT